MGLLGRDLHCISKTITFDGTAGKGAVGAVPIFTVTGQIAEALLMPYCKTSLGEAVAGATIALGVVGSTAYFIPVTDAVPTIVAGLFWVDVTPAAQKAIPAGLKDQAISTNIIATVAGQAINSGVIRFDLWYVPSPDGASVS